MSTVRNIAKNTIVIIVAQCISYLIGFLYTIYLARYLGPSGFGILSFAMAFTVLFSVLADIGLQTIIIREVARDKTQLSKYIANVALIKIITGISTFGLIVLVVNMLGYPQQTVMVVYLMGIMVILNTFSQMYYSFFQAFEKMEYVGLGLILQALLNGISVIIAVDQGYDVQVLALLYCIASIILLLYNMAFTKLYLSKESANPLSKTLEFDWQFWKTTVYESLPFALSGIFVNIYCWLDTVLLSIMKGNEIVGYYSAAYRILAIIFFMPSAFVGAVLPIMSRYYASSGDSLKLSLEKSIKYLFIIGTPISVGVIILAPRIINLVYGQQYEPASIVLQILASSILVTFLNFIFGTYLNAINKQIVGTKICFVGAIISVVFNIVLIPEYSYFATSWIRVAIECTMCILMFLSILKMGYRTVAKHNAGLIIKIVAANIFMCALTVSLGDLNIGLVITLSAVVYFALVLIFRVFDKTDVEMAMQLVGKHRPEII